jgi:predicted DNA-binding transcriptional regulator AlpA
MAYLLSSRGLVYAAIFVIINKRATIFAELARTMTKLLSTKDLAERWSLSVGHIRRLHATSPERLPPVVALPGTRLLRWRAEDVEVWEAQHVTGSPAAPSEPRRRGRPTKAQTIARRAEDGQS